MGQSTNDPKAGGSRSPSLTVNHRRDDSVPSVATGPQLKTMMNGSSYSTPPPTATTTTASVSESAPSPPVVLLPPAAKGALGNSIFKCGQCCVVPQDAGTRTWLIAFLVVFPTVVFCVSIVPADEYWSIAVACALAVFALVNLLFATTCDPGIIPRSDAPPTHLLSADHADRLCRTCYIVRPERSAHCPFCDYCVEEYDHHCGVLGCCVAKRTFRFFAMFFFATTPLALLIFIRTVIVASVTDFNQLNLTDGGRWKFAAIVGCIIFSVLSGFMVFGQAVFYFQLACTGMTQKDLFGSKKRNASEGCDCRSPCRFFGRLCGPLGYSRVTSPQIAV